eukprot:3544688-Pyramimonas_sp.AAC.1
MVCRPQPRRGRGSSGPHTKTMGRQARARWRTWLGDPRLRGRGAATRRSRAKSIATWPKREKSSGWELKFFLQLPRIAPAASAPPPSSHVPPLSFLSSRAAAGRRWPPCKGSRRT